MSIIEKEEKSVDASIRKNFGEEIDHLEKMFALFMKSYKFIHVHAEELLTEQDYAKWAIFLLFIRNLRILRCAYHSMLNGYYDVSIAIQRMAFENHLLMYFFMLKEEEAKKWWFGKRFSPRFLKREVEKSVSYNELYRDLSEFVHTNFKITRFFWKSKGEKTEIWTTTYNSTDFYAALHGISAFGAMTLMIIIPTVFKGKFKGHPLLKEIMDFDVIDRAVLKKALKKVRKPEETPSKKKTMSERASKYHTKRRQ